ncbi:3-ketoacyl-ACP reductase [Candidatus Magnetoovum chiemensis]|nr:3-ketoacyl-ACP reductase [Candidatus Magnetoovum chiemensis]
MNKIALVSGASGGLGREIVKTLTASQYTVIAIYNTNTFDRNKKKNIWHIKMDLTKKEEIEAGFNIIAQRFEHIAAIINCAAVNKDGLLIKYIDQDLDNTIAVNLTGTFKIIQHAAPFLIKSKNAHIINVSSRAGLQGSIGQAAYSASKAALIGLSMSIAKELAQYNIRVNVLVPGYMDTPMGRENLKAMKLAKEHSLINRLSSAEEAAQLVKLILTTSNITGQIFRLDNRL